MKKRRRRVTSKMVAERAGVSLTAVSFVLNGDPQGKISDETKRRILDAMAELNYKPNLLARSMRTRKTQTIGIITTGIASGWFTKIVLGAEEVLQEMKYQILLGSVSQGSTRVKSMKTNIELLLSRQVDGLIIITGSEPQAEEALEPLVDAGAPAVLVNYYSERELPFGRVYIGYKEAGFKAIEHLYKQGRRRIAYLGAPKERISGFTREIYEGYLEGLRHFSLPFLEELVWLPKTEIDHYQMGRKLAQEVLEAGADAVYCLNDYIAFGILAELNRLNIQVPRQLAVVGNDNIEAGKFVEPSLTSVDMMLESCGAKAGELLLTMLSGEKPASPLYGSVELIVRDSSRAL